MKLEEHSSVDSKMDPDVNYLNLFQHLNEMFNSLPDSMSWVKEGGYYIGDFKKDDLKNDREALEIMSRISRVMQQLCLDFYTKHGSKMKHSATPMENFFLKKEDISVCAANPNTDVAFVNGIDEKTLVLSVNFERIVDQFYRTKIRDIMGDRKLAPMLWVIIQKMI
ncbi:hypothetical protein ACFL08_03975 [Patescibacteria group bacterium]